MAEKRKDPRKAIKELFIEGNLEKLLDKAAEIHGHYCSYVAMGVRATYIAFKKLGIIESTGMEEIMAIAECNNCFLDGIQAISGCTLGNNALIYKDLGKTAATFFKRGENKAVRIAVKSSADETPKDPDAEEAMALFDKAVKRREKLTLEESRRMKELWTKISFAVLSKPEEEIFDIKEVRPQMLEYAPVFESVKCSLCGEDVMETRARIKETQYLCIPCAGDEYWVVAGRGIHPVGRK